MKNYIATLYENDEAIDITGLDENSMKLAEELFFGEYGYIKTPDMKIEIEEEE